VTDTDTMIDEERPHAPVEIRSSVTELEVDWTERTIELVAMPYDQDAAVVVNGRAVLESCAPGAYNGVERRSHRVKCNRDHDPQRTIGRAIELWPDRPEGLVAKLRLAPKLALADETLALAEDRALEASVGFCVMPGGERWLDGRSRRRLERLFLDHIALVPEGAYDAQVIAVRSAQIVVERVPTPNLDEVLAWMRDRAGT
jgi:phage head maturation protease